MENGERKSKPAIQTSSGRKRFISTLKKRISALSTSLILKAANSPWFQNGLQFLDRISITAYESIDME
jgi:hypothetical protein